MTEQSDRLIEAPVVAPDGTIAGQAVRDLGDGSGLNRDSAIGSTSGDLGPDEMRKEPADRILARLETTAAGLNATEVQSRLQAYGPNDAAAVKHAPLWVQVVSRQPNPTQDHRGGH